ncbi:MAG: hypothetical protein EAZ07_04185 [Cytophagales bacterium]|nr:MAG: hypothetical protein EAZ07_04185 [Cytophagales bacterium]
MIFHANYNLILFVTAYINLMFMENQIKAKINNSQFTEAILQVRQEREKEYFLDGNFDYYSKSKSKKYRASKYRVS